MPVPRRVRRSLAGLLLAVLVLAPTAGAHPGAEIELEAREGDRCLDRPLCLELVSLPPDLAPGHATVLELRVHANASSAYRAAFTTLEQADTDREATPSSAALATTPVGEPGETVQVDLTVPEASHGYVWLPGDDHEARGGWETFPLGMRTDGDDDRPAPGPGVPSAIVAALAGLCLRERRRS